MTRGLDGQGDRVAYSLVEGGVGPRAIDAGLAVVLHEILDVTHLVVDRVERLPRPHRTHLDSVVDEIVVLK